MTRKLSLLCLLASSFLSPSFSQPAVKVELAIKHWGEFYFPSMDWHWWRSQAVAESNLLQSCRSPVGAIGIMQLMPATARGLKVDPNDPDQNIQGGIKYDRALWGMWAGGDQLMLTFASYNAGPGCIQKASALAGSRSWPAVAAKLPAVTGKHAEETVRYVARIKGIYGGE